MKRELFTTAFLSLLLSGAGASVLQAAPIDPTAAAMEADDDSDMQADLDDEVQALDQDMDLSASDDDSQVTDSQSTDARAQRQRQRRRGACSRVKLDAAQKSQIKEAIFAYAKERITLGAELKLAKLGYAKAVFSEGDQRAAADTSGAAVTAAVSKISQARVNLGTKILFELVTPEQRKPAYLCLKSIERRHQRRAHHGRRVAREGQEVQVQSSGSAN